jgi:fructokinase
MNVLAFGEILFDIIKGEHYLGGAPLNFAAHLARQGVHSSIFSRVGRDALGAQALEQLANIGVNGEFVQLDEAHPTGTVPVEVKGGQPSYIITENVAYDYINFAESIPKLLDTDFDVLYFGTLAQRSRHARESLYQLLEQKRFQHRFYDVNLRKNCYTPLIIQHSLRQCSILKLNDDEVNVLASMLYGRSLPLQDFARQLAADYHISLILITAGAQGCYVYEKEKLQQVGGYPAQVVDTVGAGDAFSAAFLNFYLWHGDALQAADVANRLGAFVASSRGPLPAYSPELEQLLMLR